LISQWFSLYKTLGFYSSNDRILWFCGETSVFLQEKMASKGGLAAATKHTIKLLIPAGKAAPAPPVGPALGQKGVKRYSCLIGWVLWRVVLIGSRTGSVAAGLLAWDSSFWGIYEYELNGIGWMCTNHSPLTWF